MLDRNRGEKSRFVLIAISSFEATWIQGNAKSDPASPGLAGSIGLPA